jgi:hypothetical protein
MTLDDEEFVMLLFYAYVSMFISSKGALFNDSIVNDD